MICVQYTSVLVLCYVQAYGHWTLGQVTLELRFLKMTKFSELETLKMEMVECSEHAAKIMISSSTCMSSDTIHLESHI